MTPVPFDNYNKPFHQSKWKNSLVYKGGEAMVYWINCSPCIPGVVGLIPGFSSLLDETKLWHHLHMTLTVGRML